MTCELAFPRGIDPARLDENRYLESLVEQGAAAGLFSPEDKEHLQNQAMGLLARQARKYTGGDTSLPRETAAELLKSARTLRAWPWPRTPRRRPCSACGGKDWTRFFRRGRRACGGG